MNLHTEGVNLMKIQVVLKNGIQDSVPDYLIGMMIAAGEVISIRRSTGWVKVGIDPVRKGESGYWYYGPERRGLNQQMQCVSCPCFIESACINQICQIRYIQFINCTK
jgi:hypothetical protein